MKIKILNLTILLLLFSGSCFAQTKEVIDSLKSILATTKNDTTKIYAQANLCDAYRFGNPDSSTFYGQQALRLARKINFIPGQILALGFLTAPAQQQGDYPKTLELGFEAIQLAKEHHLDVLAAPALSNMAAVYANLKDYQKAIDYSHQQILLELAGHIDRRIDPGLAYGYLQMGAIHLLYNQLDSAEYYEKKAVKSFEKLNYNEPAVYQLLGDISLKSGRNNEALHYYKISKQNAIKGNRLRALTAVYNSISEYFRTLNQPDSALYYAHKGLEVSQDLGQKSSSLASAKLLSGLYEQTNPKESLRYLKIADAYRDSLFGEVNLKAIQTIVAREKERQQELEAAKTAYQNRLRLYLLLTGLSFLLLISLILYRSYKKSKKANQTLKNTLDDLKSTQSQLIQAEKLASLGQLTAGIAHEIKNPLNFVNNFSDISVELVEEARDELLALSGQLSVKDEVEKVSGFSNQLSVNSDQQKSLEEAMAILDNIEMNLRKIYEHGSRADSIVKGMLQHSRDGTGEKEPTELNALVKEFTNLSYHGMRASKDPINVDLQYELDETIGDVPLVAEDFSRVIVNLCNNAFDAMRERLQNTKKYKPKLTARTRSSNGRLMIEIEDNGPGIPAELKDKIMQPFFTTKKGKQGTGLGLSITNDIVKAHGGEIHIRSKKGAGTTFTITVSQSR